MNVFRQVLLWLGLSGAVAQAAAWPMFRGGPALLGVAEGSLPARLELLWSFKTAGPVKSSAAIDQGRVFIGSDDGNIYSLDFGNGKKKIGRASCRERVWSLEVGGSST